MRKALIYLQLFVFLIGSADASTNIIRQKLKIEVSALRKDISEADSTVYRLRDDKSKIESNLRDMESWGIVQQHDKDEYYTETVEVRRQAVEQAATSAAKIDKLKAKIELDFKKYRRLKAIACYFVAVAFVLLYLRYGARLVSLLSVSTGPWAPLLTFGGPVGAFCAGYLLVYLLF